MTVVFGKSWTNFSFALYIFTRFFFSNQQKELKWSIVRVYPEKIQNITRAQISPALLTPHHIFPKPLFQVRGHGASHRPGQDHRRHLLPVRRARDRPPCPRHRLQLLEDLSSKSAGGQEKSSEGELTFDTERTDVRATSSMIQSIFDTNSEYKTENHGWIDYRLWKC